MKRVEQVIQRIDSDIRDKDVLEVASGCAEFSASAAKIATKVCCIDLDSSRMKFSPDDYDNLEFQVMDATQMSFQDKNFDTIVMYNAIGHLDKIISKVLEECRRVLKKDGCIYVISSFKMDRWVIREVLLPRAQEIGFQVIEEADKQFTYVRIMENV